MEVGAVNGELQRASGCLSGAFRRHFDHKVKARNKNHFLLKWLIMCYVITPKRQPLDVLVNRIAKDFFHDQFEE